MLLKKINLKKRQKIFLTSFLIKQDFEILLNIFVVISKILKISWLKLQLNIIVLKSKNSLIYFCNYIKQYIIFFKYYSIVKKYFNFNLNSFVTLVEI